MELINDNLVNRLMEVMDDIKQLEKDNSYLMDLTKYLKRELDCSKRLNAQFQIREQYYKNKLQELENFKSIEERERIAQQEWEELNHG